MDDIVPGLLEDMTNDFQSQYDSSSKIKSLKEKLDKGEATYKEANEYAAEVGGITKNVYSEHLTSDNLPDGKCYYNIAERVTSQTLHDQYELVADYSEKVQTDLNKKAGIGLKAQRADENIEEYHSLANYMASAEIYDDIAKSTAQSAERMAKETVDNSVKKNAEFQYNAGLKPKIVRSGGSDCCSWCSDVTGSYDYPKVPKDVYRRHNNCTCTVEYDPGSGKRQDVWSKKWISAEEVEHRENLKTLGLDDTNKSDKIEQRKTVGLKEENTGLKVVTNREEAYKKLGEWFKDLEKLDDIDETLLVDNVNRLDELNKKFKVLDSNNTGLVTSKPKGTKIGYANCIYSQEANYYKLGLNSNYYGSFEKLIETFNKGQKIKEGKVIGYKMPADSKYATTYTVTHEYGHLLQYKIAMQRQKWETSFSGNLVVDLEKESEEQFLKMQQEIISIAKNNNPNFRITEQLSGYGGENSREFFAECFANSQCGKPNELGKAMLQWLVKEGF